MNFDTKEMIKLYSLCTGNTDKQKIISTLNQSWIFDEVRKGTNDALAYEGFLANLLEIVDDLKKQPNYPKEIDLITPEVVSAVMRTRRDEALKRRTFFEKIFSRATKVAAL